MKRKLITSLVLAGMVAFGAQAEGFTGSLYIEDATIAPGETTTLSVQLNNNIPINGFQFKMTLPEGISYTSWGLSEERLPSGATTSDKVSSQSFNNQVFICAAALNYGSTTASFTANSGEVAVITVTADESMTEGPYSITLEEIDVTDTNGKDYDYTDGIEDTSFTLTVGALSYAEGYAVTTLPFAFTEDLEIPLLMDNLTAITNIAFDVVLPSAFVSGELYYTENSLGKTKFSVSDELNSDGTIHVTVDRKSSNKVNAGTDNEIVALGLVYDSDAVPTGVYPITIKSIKLTDEGGNTFLAAPYTTEIFVGSSPIATVTDGLTAFHGNYGGADEYALLTAALPEGATIDLTKVSAMAGDPTTLRMNNVFVTADAVAYGRNVTNEWGTLCLPFAIETNDNIQLYEMTGASETGLFFDKVSSAAANTPLIFKATGEGFTLSTSNDGSFEVGYAAAQSTVSASGVDQWVINGSFVDESVDVSGIQAYALSAGEFHKVTSQINVKAFHAWLQNKGAAMGAAIRIEESTNGIDIIEQEDGTVKLIYDMQGRQLKNGERQRMYIENGKKMISINN